MYGLDLGLSRFKFFPATAAGGIPALTAVAAAFRQCRFCPTGGITQATMCDWLALDCVLCVGGSWLVPKGPPDTATIRTNAAKAARASHPARQTESQAASKRV
jgi:2-dehydro-3-deoxyphosphogluconate aldolase / (4S)-4-hydroxy-2-oxoglutarate aldolase